MEHIIGVAVLAIVYAYSLAARRCRLAPRLRVWLILASVCALGGVVLLVPWAFRLKPPWSESPAGLFLILARIIPLGLIGSGAVGAILGAAFPRLFVRPRPASHH